MLLIVLVMLRTLPEILKGKSAQEAMDTFWRVIVGLFILSGLIGVIGLVVWITVMRKK